MRYLMKCIIINFIFCASIAHAETYAQMGYGNCLVTVTSEYKDCRRASYYGTECLQEYKEQKNGCWNVFQQQSQNESYFFGGSGRYEPVPIPKRPVYVLPGMP